MQKIPGPKLQFIYWMGRGTEQGLHLKEHCTQPGLTTIFSSIPVIKSKPKGSFSYFYCYKQAEVRGRAITLKKWSDYHKPSKFTQVLNCSFSKSFLITAKRCNLDFTELIKFNIKGKKKKGKKKRFAKWLKLKWHFQLCTPASNPELKAFIRN